MPLSELDLHAARTGDTAAFERVVRASGREHGQRQSDIPQHQSTDVDCRHDDDHGVNRMNSLLSPSMALAHRAMTLSWSVR